jgi:hypothetical protein
MQKLVYGTYSSSILKDGTEVFDNGDVVVLVPRENVIYSEKIKEQIRSRVRSESE